MRQAKPGEHDIALTDENIQNIGSGRITLKEVAVVGDLQSTFHHLWAWLQERPVLKAERIFVERGPAAIKDPTQLDDALHFQHNTDLEISRTLDALDNGNRPIPELSPLFLRAELWKRLIVQAADLPPEVIADWGKPILQRLFRNANSLTLLLQKNQAAVNQIITKIAWKAWTDAAEELMTIDLPKQPLIKCPALDYSLK